MMDAIGAIIKRKSVRAYEDRPVPGHVVEKIIEAGQWAPNAGQQIGLRGLQLLPIEYAFQISVSRNKGLRRKINDRVLETMNRVDNLFARQRASLPGYQPLFGAPVVMLLSEPDQGMSGAVNVALVAENMLIAATALGLESCYLGSPAHALTGDSNTDLTREAGVPEDYVVQCAIIFGYAAPENRFSLGERTKRGKVNYVD
jgi:nitroreductase